MSYIIHYNPETNMIETEMQGNITEGELKELGLEFAKIIMQKECMYFLNDFRKARIKLSTLKIFAIPKLISEMYASFDVTAYHITRALVVANDVNDYKFFETVSINSGHTVKIFSELEEAREWLQKQQCANIKKTIIKPTDI